MKIQSVAILGAGAVGCYVLWGLADKAAANTLQLGDEMAKSLGVRVNASRLFLSAVSAFLAAATVSVAGMIGFVSGLGELVGYSMRYVFGKLTDKTTPAEALQVVKAYPDRDKLLPETQQELLMMEFGTYLNSTGDVDGAVLILDKVAELKPGTEAGMQAPRIKAGILANKDKIKAQIDAAKKAQGK